MDFWSAAATHSLVHPSTLLHPASPARPLHAGKPHDSGVPGRGLRGRGASPRWGGGRSASQGRAAKLPSLTPDRRGLRPRDAAATAEAVSADCLPDTQISSFGFSRRRLRSKGGRACNVSTEQGFDRATAMVTRCVGSTRGGPRRRRRGRSGSSWSGRPGGPGCPAPGDNKSPIPLIIRSSYPEGNFGGKQLLDGRRPPNRRETLFGGPHRSSAEPELPPNQICSGPEVPGHGLSGKPLFREEFAESLSRGLAEIRRSSGASEDPPRRREDAGAESER